MLENYYKSLSLKFSKLTHINKFFQESTDIFQHKVPTTALISRNYIVPKDTITLQGKQTLRKEWVIKLPH